MINFKAYIKAKKQYLETLTDDNAIFIYQMGKVGSTSLENSVENAVHIHAFYAKNHTCKVRQAGLDKFGLRSLIYRAERTFFEFLARKAFKRRTQTKIVTLIRKPEERNMSMFFHDIDAYLFSAHTNCISTRKRPIPTRSQSTALLTKVYDEEFDHYYPLNWYANEFEPMTGVDVFSQPFNKEKGYNIIEQDNVSVLCIRTDKLNDLIPVLEAFIGQCVNIKNDNKAESKWYSEIYRNFKNEYELPKAVKHKLKTSQFYQHFF